MGRDPKQLENTIEYKIEFALLVGKGLQYRPMGTSVSDVVWKTENDDRGEILG